MKKHTTTKLKLEKQTVRQLTCSDYRIVVGGSSVVYTCGTTVAATQIGPTVDYPA